MTSIHTLVNDIYKVVGNKDGWIDDAIAQTLGAEVSGRLKESQGYTVPRLRLSAMGPRCPKHLWHSIHTPELAEPLPAPARIKYTYGHLIEAMALAMAKAAGHEVTGEQDELVVDGIRGHRDAVIDGCIVDVKSTNSFSFKKFKDKSIAQDDSFGYLDQLDGYLVGSLDDPLVRVKDRAYLLAVDKTLGHMCIYEHHLKDGGSHIRQRIKDYKAIVAYDSPPSCTCRTVPDGKSGNIKLDVKASYSPFKYCCFPHLRTFLYATGPTYLVKVVRKPDVTEIDMHGKYVYN